MEGRGETKELEGEVDIEVRRLHIIYFLCRKGRIEQPHLIRVDHLNSNAVHLRDVKRWMAELRGAEMPDSFAWSYKRKYKAGYIWQDLADDDRISPISDDDEYVIKGSLLPSLNKTMHNTAFFNEGNIAIKKQVEEDEKHREEDPHVTLPAEDNISRKPPPACATTSTSTSTSTSASSSEGDEKRRAVFRLDSWRLETNRVEEQRRKEMVVKRNERGVNVENNNEGIDNGSCRWASDVLKNLLNCKTVETKDSFMKPTANQSNNSNTERKNWEIKGNKGKAASSSMFKPATEPNCSQCGRPFRPEKLNLHMNSCIALKEKRRR